MLHSIHNLMLTQAGDFPEALNSWRTVSYRNKKISRAFIYGNMQK